MELNAYGTTVGTLMVGIFFNTFLYGLVTYQFAVYHQTKYCDSPLTRYTVLFLFILDTFHSCAAIYMAWCYSVTYFGDPGILTMTLWPYPFTPIGTALTALVTQIYLGIRIWRFTGSKFLFCVVVVLAIPTFVLGMSCGVGAWIIWVWTEMPRLTPLVIAWLTMQVCADLFISGTLILAFYRSRTGSERIDSVLNQLIRCAIQTGAFATIFSMGDLFTFVFIPNTNFYGMFAIPVGRIYTNTFMNSLLCRESLKAKLGATFDVSAAIEALDWANSAGDSSRDTTGTTNIALQTKRIGQEMGGCSSCESAQGKTAALATDRKAPITTHPRPPSAVQTLCLEDVL